MTPKPALSWWARRPAYGPRGLYGLLLVSLLLLSYGGLSWVARAFTLLLGVLVPLGASFALAPRSSPNGPRPGARLPSLRGGWGLALLAAGCVLPFLHFNTAPPWPLQDEAHELFHGLEFARHWDGRLILGDGMREPLLPWIWGLLARVTSPTPWLLRALGTALALSSVGFSYLAARRFLGPNAAAWLAALNALTFPTFMLSKMAMGPSLIPPLLWASLWLLGGCLDRGEGKRGGGWALALGAVVGLGFYAWIPWVTAAAGVCGALVLFALQRPKHGARALGIFAATSGLVALPMALARLSPQGQVFLRGRFHPTDGGWDMLSAWFLDGKGSAPYGPAWGGMLNPLVGAAVLLGWVAWARRSPPGAARWYLGALAAAWVPAALTGDVEILRTLPALPLFLLAALLGLEELAASFPVAGRPLLLGALVLLSAGLDQVHLRWKYLPRENFPAHRQGWRSAELEKAYGILRDRVPPGSRAALLIHFFPSYRNPSLYVLTRGLDALARDEAPPPGEISRVALLCDANYAPALRALFPGAEWVLLSDRFPPNDENLLLGILPVTDRDRPRLERWVAAELALRRFHAACLDLPPDRGAGARRDALDRLRSISGGDPFLASILSECEMRDASLRRDLPAALAASGEGLRRGVRAAHLWNEYGALLWKAGDPAGARRAFQSAVAGPLDRTPARWNLLALDGDRPLPSR